MQALHSGALRASRQPASATADAVHDATGEQFGSPPLDGGITGDDQRDNEDAATSSCEGGQERTETSGAGTPDGRHEDCYASWGETLKASSRVCMTVEMRTSTRTMLTSARTVRTSARIVRTSARTVRTSAGTVLKGT